MVDNTKEIAKNSNNELKVFYIKWFNQFRTGKLYVFMIIYFTKKKI